MITCRQFDIILRVAEGKEYKEISSELHLSVRTLKWHMEKFYTEHGSHGAGRYQCQLQAVLWWVNHGSCSSWKNYLRREARLRSNAEKKNKKVISIRRAG